jgi:16S rRNA (guanine966-N2)-methyltransferase
MSSLKRNRVRIIGGQWRSSIISFPASEGLRPTPDRVREALFNWLGQTLKGRSCLDLFGGSGALGFEAASRGAPRVVIVETGRAAYVALQTNARLLQGDNTESTNLELLQRDALQFLASTRERFDVVFLDPPYCSELLPRCFALLADRLNLGGVVYFESDVDASTPPAGWQIIKSGRAGKVRFHLVKKMDSSDQGSSDDKSQAERPECRDRETDSDD